MLRSSKSSKTERHAKIALAQVRSICNVYISDIRKNLVSV